MMVLSGIPHEALQLFVIVAANSGSDRVICVHPKPSSVKRRGGKRASLRELQCRWPRSGLLAGTGTPEVGGFNTYEAQQMLRGLADIDIVASDVVEVAPPFDPMATTALNGAQMTFEIPCLMAQNLDRRRR